MNDIYDFDEEGKLDRAGRPARLHRAFKRYQEAVAEGWPKRITDQMWDEAVWPPAVGGGQQAGQG
jgi:hypothetical protein